MKTNEKFKLTYSASTAKERLEIESIKRQYLPEDEQTLKTIKQAAWFLEQEWAFHLAH